MHNRQPAIETRMESYYIIQDGTLPVQAIQASPQLSTSLPLATIGPAQSPISSGSTNPSETLERTREELVKDPPLALWRAQLAQMSCATCVHKKCLMTFLSLSGMVAHNKICLGFTREGHYVSCQICGLRFKTFRSMQVHQTKTHRAPKLEYVIDTPAGENQLVAMRTHISAISGAQSQLQQQPQGQPHQIQYQMLNQSLNQNLNQTLNQNQIVPLPNLPSTSFRQQTQQVVTSSTNPSPTPSPASASSGAPSFSRERCSTPMRTYSRRGSMDQPLLTPGAAKYLPSDILKALQEKPNNDNQEDRDAQAKRILAESKSISNPRPRGRPRTRPVKSNSRSNLSLSNPAATLYQLPQLPIQPVPQAQISQPAVPGPSTMSADAISLQGSAILSNLSFNQTSQSNVSSISPTMFPVPESRMSRYPIKEELDAKERELEEQEAKLAEYEKIVLRSEKMAEEAKQAQLEQRELNIEKKRQELKRRLACAVNYFTDDSKNSSGSNCTSPGVVMSPHHPMMILQGTGQLLPPSRLSTPSNSAEPTSSQQVDDYQESSIEDSASIRELDNLSSVSGSRNSNYSSDVNIRTACDESMESGIVMKEPTASCNPPKRAAILYGKRPLLPPEMHSVKKIKTLAPMHSNQDDIHYEETPDMIHEPDVIQPENQGEKEKDSADHHKVLDVSNTNTPPQNAINEHDNKTQDSGGLSLDTVASKMIVESDPEPDASICSNPKTAFASTQ